MKLPKMAKYEVYVDGAYFPANKVVTWGFFIEDSSNKRLHSETSFSIELTNTQYAQVYGEISAVLKAMSWINNNLNEGIININYDYEGIRSWALNYWKANYPATQNYKSLMNNYLNNPSYVINFIKVNGHKGKNKEVHDIIQLKEYQQGVFEVNGTLLVNLMTDDEDLKQFFRSKNVRIVEDRPFWAS